MAKQLQELPCYNSFFQCSYPPAIPLAEELGLKAAKSLGDKILELGLENVVCFIAEPIQGAGGVIIHR